MFVSDAVTGIFWRIGYNASAGQYQRWIHVNGFSRALGLAITPDGTQLYGAATTTAGEYVIIAMDPKVQKQYKILARLEKAGNGLALHFATGLLYTATEVHQFDNGRNKFSVLLCRDHSYL